MLVLPEQQEIEIELDNALSIYSRAPIYFIKEGKKYLVADDLVELKLDILRIRVDG